MVGARLSYICRFNSLSGKFSEFTKELKKIVELAPCLHC